MASHRHGIARGLLLRQSGQMPERTLLSRVWSRRLSSLGLSTSVEIKKDVQRGPVNSMSLDPEQGRFLLVGAGDSSIGVYDLEGGKSDPNEPEGPLQVTALKVASKQTDAARGGAQQVHGYAVTTVQWYPVDTGLFISGSTDGTIKVWDTNAFQAVGSFQIGTKVYGAAMSPVMSSHSLIAVASEERRVRLCDLNSGGSSHVLMGHMDAVMAVTWSPRDEHLLATGSKDSTVRLWDVRRSGPSACLTSFDQHLDHTRVRTEGARGGAPSELAKAHDGIVVTTAFTPDGLWLVSAGTDKKVRVWNTTSECNTLTRFLDTRNNRPLGWAITVAQSGDSSTARMFYPNGTSGDVLVFPLHGGSGRPSQVLKGHLDSVYSVVYRESKQQVITGGADSIVLVHDRSLRDGEEVARLDAAEEGGGGSSSNGRKRRREGGGAEWSDQEGDEDDDDDEEAGQEEGGRARSGSSRGGFVPPIVGTLFGGGRGGTASGGGGGSRA